MTQWFLQQDGNSGPAMSFEELVRRVADGVISDADLVRSDHTAEWQSVDSVIGLDRAVRKLLQSEITDTAALPDRATPRPAPQRRHKPEQSSANSESVPRVTESQASAGSMLTVRVRPVPIAAIAVVGCVAGWFLWSDWNQARRFPRPPGMPAPSIDWWFPVIGTVSSLEFAMLCFDVVAVVALAICWLRGRRGRR